MVLKEFNNEVVISVELSARYLIDKGLLPHVDVCNTVISQLY